MKKPIYNVSIVIPCYDDTAALKRLLDGLRTQNCSSMEVIVAEADATAATHRLINQYTDYFPITHIDALAPQGAGVARNIGANYAEGKWLLFLDADDAIDDPSFVTTLQQATEYCDWGASTSNTKTHSGRWFGRINMYIHHVYVKLLSTTTRPAALGSCIFVRRDIFFKYNGFSETLRFAEDYDFVTKVQPDGFGIVKDTYYYVDTRRFDKEGGWLIAKALLSEVYRQTHGGRIPKNFFRHDPIHQQRTQAFRKLVASSCSIWYSSSMKRLKLLSSSDR